MAQPHPSPEEQIRALESRLSALIDAHDVPDWQVNPAFAPAVTAFIEAHAGNAAFLKKAQSLQANRARYFAAARAAAAQPRRRQRLNAPPRDRFGHLRAAPPGQINAVLTAQPQTVAEIAARCGHPVERVLQHLDTWFGTDRRLGQVLRREVPPGPRSGERYWLAEPGAADAHR